MHEGNWLNLIPQELQLSRFYINIKKHYIETFYYVNGKRVSADTYFATGKNLEWKKYMYKACISYYKAHPDEFDAILGGHPKSHYSLV